MAETEAQTWALTVTLSEPIELRAKDGGELLETVTELRFRKPTAMDTIEVGTNPVSIDLFAENPASTIKFEAKAMSHMMARLSGKPASTIGRMNTNDWTYCAYQLSGFFLPARVMTS